MVFKLRGQYLLFRQIFEGANPYFCPFYLISLWNIEGAIAPSAPYNYATDCASPNFT